MKEIEFIKLKTFYPVDEIIKLVKKAMKENRPIIIGNEKDVTELENKLGYRISHE